MLIHRSVVNETTCSQTLIADVPNGAYRTYKSIGFDIPARGYSQNMYCVYSIVTRNVNTVVSVLVIAQNAYKLSFLQFRHIQLASGDYLQIYDGPSVGRDALLLNYTSESVLKPGVFVSIGSVLTVVFRSQVNSDCGKGFVFDYKVS